MTKTGHRLPYFVAGNSAPRPASAIANTTIPLPCQAAALRLADNNETPATMQAPTSRTLPPAAPEALPGSLSDERNEPVVSRNSNAKQKQIPAPMAFMIFRGNRPPASGKPSPGSVSAPRRFAGSAGRALLGRWESTSA